MALTKIHSDMMPAIPTPGIEIVKTTYTAGATWTKHANLLYIEAEVQGGGGGGGARNNSGILPPGPGSGGGYGKKLIQASALGATETVTVGAAGAGATSGGNGGTGGTSSFGTHLSATGGVGGVGSNNSGIKDAGAPGTSTGGDINIPGERGIASHIDEIGGHGGGSHLGKGAVATYSNGHGQAATGFGAGGSSPRGNVSDATSRNGGAGSQGCVIVTEYRRL